MHFLRPSIWLNNYEDCVATSTASILPERIAWDKDYPVYINNMAEDVISIALPINAHIGVNCTGMIIVNIEKNELFNVNQSDNFSCFIYKENKSLITSYKGQEMDGELFNEVINHQSPDNSVVQLSPSDSREQYNVYYKELPKFNVTYSIINSMSPVQKMLQGIQIAVLSIMIGSIVLCMLIAVQIARKYCTPIMTISHDLQEFVPLGEKEDHLRYITGAVASISSKYREMSHADSDLISNLFSTSIIDEPIQGSSFFCAVVSIDNYHSVAAQKGIAEVRDIKKELISYTHQRFHESTVCEGIILDSDKVLLAFKLKELLSADGIEELLRGMMADFEIEMSVGVGGQYEKRSDLTQSYLEALDAVKYRLVLGHRCVALYDEIIIGRGEVITKQLRISELLCDICQSVFELLIYKRDDEVYMDTISDIIDLEYSDPQLDINSIAEKVGISYSYVCKIVKERTKLSFTNYLNRYRIGKAKQQLEKTDFSVRQIAESVGYVNDQSLTRYFKKFESITPGKYRKLRGEPKTKHN